MSHTSTIQRATQTLNDRQKNKSPNRPPSRRAQEIYKRITVGCERQCDLAEELGVTRSRISQIVRRVRRWLAAGSQGDPDVLAHRERQRLERMLAKARLEVVNERMIRLADRLEAQPDQTTVKTETKCQRGDRGQETGDSESRVPSSLSPVSCPLSPASSDDDATVKVTTTVRSSAFNSQIIQALKTAERSASELQKLAELDPLPEPTPAMPSDNELFVAIFNILCDWRRRAEHAGRVVPSCNVPSLIQHFLAAVLGRKCGYGIAHDPAAREAVRSLAIGTLKPGAWPEAEKLVAEVRCQEPAALADELVPPPGGETIPNPLLLLGPDETLPPVANEGARERRGEGETRSRVGPASAASASPPEVRPQVQSSKFKVQSCEAEQTLNLEFGTLNSPPPPPTLAAATTTNTSATSTPQPIAATPLAVSVSASTPAASTRPKSPSPAPEKTAKLTTPPVPPPIRVLWPPCLSLSPSP